MPEEYSRIKPDWSEPGALPLQEAIGQVPRLGLAACHRAGGEVGEGAYFFALCPWCVQPTHRISGTDVISDT
jgi:hypothetical protein